jgi:hypothetical protein
MYHFRTGIVIMPYRDNLQPAARTGIGGAILPNPSPRNGSHENQRHPAR